MADQTLDQLPEAMEATDSDLLYVRRDGTDHKMKRAAIVQGRVPATRRVDTSRGVKGGGTLGADLSLQLDLAGLSEDLNPNISADYVIIQDVSEGLPKRVRLDRLPGGTGGGGSSSNSFANIAVGTTTVTADSTSDTLTLAGGSNISVSADAATDTITFAATNVVPATRSVSAGPGLSGGGTLTADRALAISIVSQSEDTQPDLANDYLLTHDTSTNSLRKVRLELLGGASALPQIASPSTLGVIRIGPGLTIDPATGIVSSTASYTLPAATTTTRGGITIGTGLTVSGTGVLSNPNPTPYVPQVATAGAAGIVKPGTGLTVALDGTLNVVGDTGGGGVIADGAYRPETYGAIRGVGLSQAQRQTNSAAINQCWGDAAGAKGRVDMGGGVFEIHGPLAITGSGFVIEGARCVIRQFQTGANVVAAASVNRITLQGVSLAYGTDQTAGTNPTASENYAAALRLSSVSDSHFEDIETTGAWVGIGVSGSSGSFNNTFMHVKINMTNGLGHGLVHKTGTGSAFVNCRVTGNGTPATVGGGVWLAGMEQTHFTQLTVEDLICQRPLAMSSCPTCSFSGTVFANLTPTTTNGYAGLIHGLGGTSAQFAGSLVSKASLSNGQGVTDAAIYLGDQGFSVIATNLFVTGTVKTGSVRFALLGNSSSAAALNLTGTLQQVRLDIRPDTPHRVDDLCYATVDPTSDSLDGPLLAYNNSVGGATGGFTTYTPDLSIYYPSVHGRHIRISSPLTGNISLTLSQYIDEPYANAALNAPRVYRGAVVRIERAESATGPFLVTVNSHTGTGLTTLAAGVSADFVFGNGAWTLMSAQGGGGGGGGTFATQAEAQAGVSSTTYMSPVRTRDAIDAYASTNEITGAEGQVVGFNASGDAVPVKNTRAIVVPLFAETTAVTVGVGVRTLRMPIALKLTAVEMYLPGSGTTATTLDVNLNGSTVLSAPVTIAASGTVASSTAFVTGTLTKGGIVTFDVDAAGSGARGLQVTLIGSEV